MTWQQHGKVAMAKEPMQQKSSHHIAPGALCFDNAMLMI
jgi:hypothetical protein